MKYICLFFLLISSFCFGQHGKPVPGCTELYFRYVTETLAHDSMEGRLPGTASEKKSAFFISQEFRRMNCNKVKGITNQPFDYRSPDSITVIHSAGNVMMKVDCPKQDHFIVVSAHYDHIGQGKYHSKAPFSHEVHNGADDNASGVAMLLGLAAWAREHKKELKYDIVFVAFSGEEDGLYGSEYFLNHCPYDTARILCNINLDMVGRLDLQRPILRLDGVQDFASWDSVLPSDSAKGFLVQRRATIIAGGDDHIRFQEKGIPAFLVTTGLHSEYHTPADDCKRLNYSGMILIADYLEKLLLNMGRRDLVKLMR
jgi:Peptidase family M28